MYKRKYHIIYCLVIVTLLYLSSFQLNDWFIKTMPRHQLLQLPAMLFLGILTGLIFRKILIRDISWGIAILIFIMSSLIFWMLPRSIDAAVIDSSFNRLMHLNMFITGFLLLPVLRKIIFEIKIVFLGMLSAMVLATGVTLKSFNMLLCSSFTINQQNETGFYLTMIGFALFMMTMIIFFSGLGSKKQSSTLTDVH